MMKTGRIRLFIFLFLSVLCLSATSCRNGQDPYSAALELYGNNDHAGAEPFFITALEGGDTRLQVRVGHAVNLMCLKEYGDAVSEFLEAEKLAGDNDTLAAIKKEMLSAYFAEGNYAGAARVSEELSRIVQDQEEALKYLLQAGQIRADLYLARGDTEQYRSELKKIIELKDFAQDEYVKLYRLAAEEPDYTARLKIADEMIFYIMGRTAYVEDYMPFLSVLFDASSVAGYAGYDHDAEYYYSMIGEFMEKAEDAGTPEEELLRLRIVLAEHQGKNELAYKLLGVYLNHCPDDALAVKEKDYLENRIGF